MTHNQPILVFGGPYSNLQALDAVLVEAARRDIPDCNIISTGDLVAYCGDARAVVARFRERGIAFVQGNCEEQLAAGAEDCGCGFAPGSSCDRLSAAWFTHAMTQLDAADRAFLGTAPSVLRIEMNGVRLAFIHGAAASINRFVFASAPWRVKANDLAGLDADAIIAGHCGLPFTQSAVGRLWHNPGALGMPANDGTPRTWFSIITPLPGPGRLQIEHLALDYDHAAAARAMRDAGLPQDYAISLDTGLWPSCGSLPVPEANAAGQALQPCKLVFDKSGATELAWPAVGTVPLLAAEKFKTRSVTANGEARGRVPLAQLETLWINTGTLCNLACTQCYIESSPTNDRLSNIAASEVRPLLDEAKAMGTRVIGFTGGEPFLNRELPQMLDDALTRGFDVLVLTNAMRPMMKQRKELLALKERFGAKLALRVSLDHYEADIHDLERGPRAFAKSLEGLSFLVAHEFALSIAGRMLSGEAEGIVRAGYAGLFAEHGIALDAMSPSDLVIFPEMDAGIDVPEITESCWDILGKSRRDVMCATSRMAVKRKGSDAPVLVACTLLPYEPEFEMGATLHAASGEVLLNHPHCAKFCVLGGASCSA